MLLLLVRLSTFDRDELEAVVDLRRAFDLWIEILSNQYGIERFMRRLGTWGAAQSYSVLARPARTVQ